MEGGALEATTGGAGSWEGAGAAGAGRSCFTVSTETRRRGVVRWTSEILREPRIQAPQAGRMLTQRMWSNGAVEGAGARTWTSSTQTCPPGSHPAPPICTKRPVRWVICWAIQFFPQEVWSQILLSKKMSTGRISSAATTIRTQSLRRRGSDELAGRGVMQAWGNRLPCD